MGRMTRPRRIVAWTGMATAAAVWVVLLAVPACQPTRMPAAAVAPPPPPMAATSMPAAPAAVPGPAANGLARLTVRVADVRNQTGDLLVCVFRSADGFPSDQAKAAVWKVLPADGNGVFTADLPPGTYAAAVLHDENGNGKMDKNFLGIPEEGYGVTNNPKPRRRAATFDEAAFTSPQPGPR